MGVDEEFERVRTALRTEEQALARELDQIDAEARATVDASVEHVRAQLATQADRIREAIAQQREEVEARQEEFRDEDAEWTEALDAGAGLDAGTDEPEHTGDGGAEHTDDGGAEHTDDGGAEHTDADRAEHAAEDDDAESTAYVEQRDGTGVEQVSSGTDEPDDLIGDVERGD